MAIRIGKLLESGSGRSSGGFQASWQNVSLVESALKKITNDIAANDARTAVRSIASSHLRKEVKKIAEDEVVPALHRSAAASPTRIAKHMSIRAKADRFVSVQIGGANPKGLVGFKPYIGASRAEGRTITAGKRAKTSRTYRTTLAWGSEFGPHPESKVNHYGLPRSEKGYWVQPGVNSVMDRVRDKYADALQDMIDKFSRRR